MWQLQVGGSGQASQLLPKIIPYTVTSITSSCIVNYACCSGITEFVIINLNSNWHVTFYSINAYYEYDSSEQL